MHTPIEILTTDLNTLDINPRTLASFLPLLHLFPPPLSFSHPRTPTIDPGDSSKGKLETTPPKYPEKQPKDSLKNSDKPIQKPRKNNPLNPQKTQREKTSKRSRFRTSTENLNTTMSSSHSFIESFFWVLL